MDVTLLRNLKQFKSRIQDISRSLISRLALQEKKTMEVASSHVSVIYIRNTGFSFCSQPPLPNPWEYKGTSRGVQAPKA